MLWNKLYTRVHNAKADGGFWNVAYESTVNNGKSGRGPDVGGFQVERGVDCGGGEGSLE